MTGYHVTKENMLPIEGYLVQTNRSLCTCIKFFSFTVWTIFLIARSKALYCQVRPNELTRQPFIKLHWRFPVFWRKSFLRLLIVFLRSDIDTTNPRGVMVSTLTFHSIFKLKLQTFSFYIWLCPHNQVKHILAF